MVFDSLTKSRNVRYPTFAVSFPNEDQSLGRRVGKRPQQHRLDDAVNRRRGADGESQGENGDGGERGRSTQQTCGDAKIGEEGHHEIVSWASACVEIPQRGHRLTENPERAACLVFDEVSDDRVAHFWSQKPLEEPRGEADHDGSSPTSSPAAIVRSVLNVACSDRLPALVTA